MITKAKYKICRRLGAGVYEKCQTAKFVASEARHANKKGGKRKNLSEYGSQLIEKQKVRFFYGLSEKQFSNYVKKAVASKSDNIAEKLFKSLESRLDNVVYRLGLAGTRSFARQMVSHGHLTVNGKKVTIPSYKVSLGDVISIREGSLKKPLFADLDVRMKDYSTPTWLTWDEKGHKGTLKEEPKEIDSFLDINTVLEFYSR